LRLCSGKHSRRCCGGTYALEKVSAFDSHGHPTLHVLRPPHHKDRSLQLHGTAARVCAGEQHRMLARNRAAVPPQGIGSDRTTKRPTSIQAQSLDISSTAQSLDGGPSNGEPALPRASKINPDGHLRKSCFGWSPCCYRKLVKACAASKQDLPLSLNV
jgi:hypothetical protein